MLKRVISMHNRSKKMKMSDYALIMHGFDFRKSYDCWTAMLLPSTMYKQLWCKEITSAVILAALHLPTTQLSSRVVACVCN